MSLLQFFNAAGTATEDGIFIPTSNLPGCLSTELDSLEKTQAEMEGQVIHSLFKAMSQVANPTVTSVSFLTTPQTSGNNRLGVGITRTQSSVRNGIIDQVFAVAITSLIDLAAETIQMIPLSATGIYSGKGKLSITDVFPNAVKVAASGAVAGAGVVIGSTTLQNYAAPTHASLNVANDCRAWFNGLFQALYKPGNILVRGTSQVSAIVSAPTKNDDRVTLPSGATDPTNPTTGISSATFISLLITTYTYTIQVLVGDDETNKPNVA